MVDFDQGFRKYFVNIVIYVGYYVIVNYVCIKNI